ncbi:MAG: hypothetical protein QG577_2537, partial [Thermodesulfobacteriota bacterium]|nr:hypothetical protein [Thermodesulfobacteriota bacterium]
MNQLRLYLCALGLILIGLAVFSYKAYYLGFPLSPKTKVQVWHLEARLRFEAEGAPVKLSMFLPMNTGRFAVTDEHFISTGYGLVASMEAVNRTVVWSTRQENGPQNLFYQATVRMVRNKTSKPDTRPAEITNPGFKGPKLAAADSLISNMKSKSADTRSFVAELLKRLNSANPDDNVQLLLGKKTTPRAKVELAAHLLNHAEIPARVVHGIDLNEEKSEFSKKVNLLHWLEVYDNRTWVTFDPATAISPVPVEWLPWWRGDNNLVQLQGGSKLNQTLSVSPKVDEGISSVAIRGEISKPLLLKFSLFSLPVNTQ